MQHVTIRGMVRAFWSIVSVACVAIVIGGLSYSILYIYPRSARPEPQFRPYSATEPTEPIRLESAADIDAKRRELIAYIWRDGSGPEDMWPTRIDEHVTDHGLSFPALADVTQLTIEMRHGVNSVVYLLHPKSPIQRLAIFHHAHTPYFATGVNAPLIDRMLQGGYHVLVFNTPLDGLNNRPIIDVPGIGPVPFERHVQFALLATDNFSPLRYWFEPIAAALNYAERTYGFDRAIASGGSGGGWAITVYAAIDPRIQRSYPVAGSLPLYLRSAPDENPSEWDWEDTMLPDFYRIANYSELYLMAAYGPGRAHVHILNRYDPCCYAGVRHHAYERAVQERLRALGAGEFRVVLDETHREHKISAFAQDVILADLSQQSSPTSAAVP